MPYGKLWPVHLKHFPDELLSSWIVRVASANGIKLQTLSCMLFGNERSPWNRDIDRNAPRWLIDAFSQHTGTNYWDVLHSTLVTYRARLYPRRHAVGQLRWVLPVGNHGVRRESFGQQFCPECLAGDPLPYFRKQWRVALFTYCPVHHVELHDACPACGVPIILFRGDFGRELKDARPMHVCYSCGYDYRGADQTPVFFPSEELRALFDGILLSLNKPAHEAGRFDLGFYAVMHQFCRVMSMRMNGGKLQNYTAGRLHIPAVPVGLGRATIEQRRRDVRHHLLLCALWLMADIQPRLEAAWLAKAIRYNLMLRDFEAPPGWYRNLSGGFSNWRSRFSQA